MTRHELVTRIKSRLDVSVAVTDVADFEREAQAKALRWAAHAWTNEAGLTYCTDLLELADLIEGGEREVT